MKAYDAVKIAARNSGTNITSLSLSCGKSQNAISDAVRKGKDPSSATLSGYLERCGYALAAVPEGDLPETALVINGKEDRDVKTKQN